MIFSAKIFKDDIEIDFGNGLSFEIPNSQVDYKPYIIHEVIFEVSRIFCNVHGKDLNF